MRAAVIAVPALALAGFFAAQPVVALPTAMPAITAAPPAPLLVRYHRHHRHYYSDRYDAGRDRASTTAAEALDQSIKPGEWEFAAQLQAQTAGVPPGGRQAIPEAGGLKNLYRSCIAPQAPVPAALGPGCKLDNAARSGGQITWAMTCTNRSNAVHSDGTAQYRGETMEGVMVSHLPTEGSGAAGKNGTGAKLTDLTQRITGRYLGPCPQSAQNAVQPQTPIIPPRETAAPAGQTGAQVQWVEPPADARKTASSANPAGPPPATEAVTGAAATGGSTPPPAAAEAAAASATSTAPAAEEATAATPGFSRWHGRRYARRWWHRHYRHSGYGYYPAFGYYGYGAAGFGPRPGPSR